MATPNAARHKSELESITDHAEDYIMLFDPDFRHLFVNRALAELMGRAAADFVGKTQAEMGWPPELCALWEGHMRTVASSGKAEKLEYEASLPRGRFMLQTLISPIKHKDASVQALIAITRDIDAQKRVQDSFNRAYKRIRLLLEATDEGIIGLDENGACSFVNPAATRMLGRRQDEMLGQKLYSLVRHTRENGVEVKFEDSPIFRCLHKTQRFRSSGDLFWLDELRSIQVEYSVSPVVADDASTGGAVMIFHDISDKHAMTHELNHQALHDPLTGLVNRRGFEAKLAELLASAKSANREHVLCYMDLDNFKLVNDTCGHVAGDELLRQLPKILQPQVRSHDTLARLGGDEFAVLLEDCPLSRATRIAEALREAIRGFRFAWQYRSFTVGVSIGVVNITAQSQDPANVMSAADAACYAAKEKGKNNVHVSYPHDLAIIRRRGEMRWAARLKTALEENQFRLYYQSIVDVRNRDAAPQTHEILLRLLDSKGDLILPGAFIPAAERYQMMSAIDVWMVQNAMRFLGESVVPNKTFQQHKFGINLSGDSLRDDRLLDTIGQGLLEHKIPPEMLYFEITETAAIANLGAAVEFMRNLKKLGCKLALDDFGSGMSSFSYLKHLPVDYLKIDGSFIQDILDNPVDQAIVRAINSVGQQMGIRTVAEYVETEEIFVCLKQIGVDYAQGHAFMQAQPLQDLLTAPRGRLTASSAPGVRALESSS